MSKGILEFNLPEEQSEFERAVNASKYSGALWEIQQYIRDLRKHGHKFKTVDEAVEMIANRIYEEIGELDFS